ncbi:MAG: hypothetical protein JNK84_06555 [Phreatobacter sp.]|uniref:hypothetical protein n=1 Tax=Phreatobacter sp. TaxID=1966341 RepID=UPI001A59CAD2|nr:hypothetical protein [Phreatobacter sp.]MBL8568730.1 hypothetical protein [Phreatobacter sp.]
MTNLPDLIDLVRALLLADWDSIGIRDEPKAQDEYDDYAPAIAELLHSGVETDAIAEHLRRIETDQMSLPPNTKRARHVAARLRQLSA